MRIDINFITALRYGNRYARIHIDMGIDMPDGFGRRWATRGAAPDRGVAADRATAARVAMLDGAARACHTSFFMRFLLLSTALHCCVGGRVLPLDLVSCAVRSACSARGDRHMRRGLDHTARTVRGQRHRKETEETPRQSAARTLETRSRRRAAHERAGRREARITAREDRS
jgi:hypothetical protein